jgi:branched-chain amino acid transport system permease protein
MTLPAISFSAFGQPEFWIGVGVLAGIYGIFVLALQLNVGFTGIINFGQVGFMSVGAYAMAVLVLKAHWSFWLALPTASAVAVAAGLLIGLPSLRLRADYFAIATIAFAEIIRYVAENARGLTNGNIGLLGFDPSWVSVSNSIQGWLSTSEIQLPLLLVTWCLFGALTVVMHRVQRTPWGRVLRAVREDEDAARALGKNVFLYKLQSLAIAALLGSVAGYLLALDLAYISPDQFDPSVTFIGYAILILGGLASYAGIAAGTAIMWVLLEGTRFIDLPLSAEQIAALRFVIVGVVLIGLMAFRPQGLFGKREEMVLGA